MAQEQAVEGKALGAEDRLPEAMLEVEGVAPRLARQAGRRLLEQL